MGGVIGAGGRAEGWRMKVRHMPMGMVTGPVAGLMPVVAAVTVEELALPSELKAVTK